MTAAVMDNREWYASVTYQVESPDGRAFVNICESEDKRPMLIQINIGKAGAAIGAWAFTTAALLTALLEKGAGVNDLITLLSQQTADHVILTPHQVPVRSGPDAVCVALMMYRADKFRELRETMDGSGSEEEYRAGTFSSLAN